MQKKSFVLDTNIFLTDAESLFKFEEHHIVIPFPVLEEMDTFKKDQSELGRNARAFSRYMDVLREKGKLIDGVEANEQGGRVFVVLFDQSVGNCLPFQDMSLADNRILATCKYVETYGKIDSKEVILVSLDTNLRIKSDVLGIKAEDYKNNKVGNSDEMYTGHRHIEVEYTLIESIYERGYLVLSDIFSVENEPYPNECFTLHSTSNTKQSALVRYNKIMRKFNLLPQDLKTVDIIPKNTEQQFAIDMLKDTDLSLVSISGLAGSGKTLISLAAGLDAVLNKQQYTKVLLLKPIIAMDNSHELGFLPGTMAEKLAPWMSSYIDNISVIMADYIKDDPYKKKKTKKEVDVYNEKQQGKTNPVQELVELGLLEMGSLEHMRGRSLPNQFIIVDEVQNCSPNTLKTVLTRAGEGTKIVLLGDISQIDTPYLDSRSNGLSIVTEKFRDQHISGHITLKKSERSQLAKISAEIM